MAKRAAAGHQPELLAVEARAYSLALAGESVLRLYLCVVSRD
jgi:hypothetical protein